METRKPDELMAQMRKDNAASLVTVALLTVFVIGLSWRTRELADERDAANARIEAMTWEVEKLSGQRRPPATIPKAED